MPDDLKPQPPRPWTVAEAKADFDGLVAKAAATPQRVTLPDGRVLRVEVEGEGGVVPLPDYGPEYNRAFTRLLLAIPKAPADEPEDFELFERIPIVPRDIDW